MAYDLTLAQRVRTQLAGEPGFAERHMFGGLCFLIHGNMCCGVVGGDLVVRVGKGNHEMVASLPHARPMDFTGRPLRGMIYVDAAGVEELAQLQHWVARGVAFAQSLPPK